MKDSPQIALLIEQTSTHTRGIAKGISRYSRTHGPWKFMMQEYREGGQLVASPLDSLKNFNGDGIIAYTSNKKHIDEIAKSKLPVVNTTSTIAPNLELPSVYSDDFAVGKLVAKYFMNKGFSDFALCSFSSNLWQWSTTREQGFVETLASEGYSCARNPLNTAKARKNSWKQEKRQIAKWIESLKKPVAMMAIDDTHGRVAAEICLQLDILVPEEIAIVGVDNNELVCEFSNPSLSSVVLAKERIGFEAARLLDNILQGHKYTSKPILIPPVQIITRRSSDILAVQDEYVAEALNFIYEKCSEAIGVDDILEKIPLSRRYLELRFKKAIGRSPYEEIKRSHIQRAKILLSETSLQMPQVAKESGFSDARQLSTNFHKETGMTPTKYRQQFRNL